MSKAIEYEKAAQRDIEQAENRDPFTLEILIHGARGDSAPGFQRLIAELLTITHIKALRITRTEVHATIIVPPYEVSAESLHALVARIRRLGAAAYRAGAGMKPE